MADSSVEVVPSYMKYNTADVVHILESVEHIDAEPKAESANPVSSGGVAAAIRRVAGSIVFASDEEILDVVRGWTPPAT